ncbi:hypothetical protein Emag_004082 [Eimeria magna]
MGSQKAAASEFIGCFLLAMIAGILPMMKINGLDFALSLSLGYGVLLTALHNMEASSLNPALTVADMLAGKVEAAAGGLIIGAQFAGAGVGALLLSGLMHNTEIFPVSALTGETGQAMLVQLTFGAALVFAYLRGLEGNKYDGMWLAALMYGAFVIGGNPIMCLNPAVALAVDIGRGVSGISIDSTLLAVLVLMPLAGAGAGFLLHKSADQNLQMSELVGTFFLSFGILAAAIMGGFHAGVGLAFYSAAIIRMVAPVSGGSLNPAVVAGALLSEGRGVSKDVVTIWLFQLGGGILAALLAQQAIGSLPTMVTLLGGEAHSLLIALGIGALLMFSYCIDFGEFFGSPASAAIGAVYGLSLTAGKYGVPINPATSFGAALAGLFMGYRTPGLFESTAAILVPVFGCMAGAALLRFIPAEYRRRL